VQTTIYSDFFRQALQQSKLSHAYLLAGRASLEEKTNFVLSIAQLLNCTHDQVERRPCQKCQQTNFSESVFTVEPDPNSKRGEILLSQVKTLLQQIRHTSSLWRLTIFSSAQQDVLRTESANALLKTLEEPPAKAIFFLCCNDKDLVLPTIGSRCQVISLSGRSGIAAESEHGLKLAQKVFEGGRLDYAEVSEIASQLVLEDLEGLLLYVLNRSSEHIIWLHRISILERAIKRIESFCSQKSVCEEAILRLNQDIL